MTHPIYNNKPLDNITTCRFSVENDILLVDIQNDNQSILEYRLNFHDQKQETLTYILFCATHNFLYNVLPVQDITVAIDNSVLQCGGEYLNKIVTELGSTFINTNQYLQQIDRECIDSSSFNGTFIYNVDDHKLLRDIFEREQMKPRDELIYKNLFSGFDVFRREWREPEGLINPSHLIKLITEHKIKRIISINTIYPEHAHSFFNVWIFSLLKRIGVSWIVIDWDIPALTPTLGVSKAAFNCSSFTRYTIFPSIERDWDQQIGLTNIKYMPTHYTEEQTIQLPKLDNNYKILCAATGYLQQLLHDSILGRILEAFEFVNDDNIFQEFQFWFHVMSYYVAHKYQGGLFQKLILRTMLLNVHFKGIGLLKYEVLDQLNTKRQLLLFGSENWADIYPQYYQGRYLPLDELKQMLATKKYLYLLFNNKFSFPEPNEVVGTAVTFGAPFIDFPATVYTPELEGLKKIGYRSIADLNNKIDNVNTIMEDSDFKNSLKYYAQFMGRSAFLFREGLLTDNPKTNDEFEAICLQHRNIFVQHAEEYIEQNIKRIQAYIERLIRSESFDITQSRYYNRSYVQKIIELKERAKNVK